MFYLFIVVSNFLSLKVFNNTKSSKLYTIIRISVSLMYILSMFAISYMIQYIPTLANSDLLSKYIGSGHYHEVNVVSSLIVFPLSSAYIILFAITPLNLISSTIILSSGLGILIFFLVIIRLVKKGNRILSNLSYEESGSVFKKEKKITDPESVKIKMNGPKVAYIKRVFIMITREQGKLMIFILPILFPIIFAFSFRTTSGTSTTLNPFYSLFFYFAIIPYFLNNGLSEAEEGLGGLLSTLPIKNRDIFRSKQYITVFFMLLSSITYILIIGTKIALENPVSLIKIGFLCLIIPPINLLLYSVFFGKINNQYTSFKVNTSNSAMKNIFLVGIQIAVIMILAGITVPSILYLVGLNILILIFIEVIIRIFI